MMRWSTNLISNNPAAHLSFSVRVAAHFDYARIPIPYTTKPLETLKYRTIKTNIRIINIALAITI